MTNNPFANWLGAIVAKTTTEAPPPPPPAPKAAVDNSPAPQTVLSPPPGVTPPPAENTSFLSPRDILAGSKTTGVEEEKPSAVKTNSRQSTPTATNRQEKKKVNKQSTDGKRTILKREVPLAMNASTTESQLNKNGVADNAAVVEQVRRVVQEEVRTTVIPSLRQAISDSFSKSSHVADKLPTSCSHCRLHWML